MSVSFKNRSFTIEVSAGHDPVENWLETQHDLLDILQSQDEDMLSKHSHCLELLRSLLPAVDLAKKMTK